MKALNKILCILVAVMILSSCFSLGCFAGGKTSEDSKADNGVLKLRVIDDGSEILGVAIGKNRKTAYIVTGYNKELTIANTELVDYKDIVIESVMYDSVSGLAVLKLNEKTKDIKPVVINKGDNKEALTYNIFTDIMQSEKADAQLNADDYYVNGAVQYSPGKALLFDSKSRLCGVYTGRADNTPPSTAQPTTEITEENTTAINEIENDTTKRDIIADRDTTANVNEYTAPTTPPYEVPETTTNAANAVTTESNTVFAPITTTSPSMTTPSIPVTTTSVPVATTSVPTTESSTAPVVTAENSTAPVTITENSVGQGTTAASTTQPVVENVQPTTVAPTTLPEAPLQEANISRVQMSNQTDVSEISRVKFAGMQCLEPVAFQELDEKEYSFVDGTSTPWLKILVALCVIAVLVFITIVILIVFRNRKKTVQNTVYAGNAQVGQNAANNRIRTIQITRSKTRLLSQQVVIYGVSGCFAGKSFRLIDNLEFGIDPFRCSIAFPQDTSKISGVHCVIGRSANGIYLKDGDSAYGTYLENGTRLIAGEAVPLYSGMRFYIADRNNMFEIRM